MTELSREEQVAALSQAMSTMPGMDPTKQRTTIAAPARALWAAELIDKWGVTIDPSKATVESFSTNPAEIGNHGPQQVRERDPNKTAEMDDLLRQQGPAFLRFNNPDLAARLAAAKTQPQRDALVAELREKIQNDPNSLLNNVLQLVKDTDKRDGPAS
jgi:hypothetical protein